MGRIINISTVLAVCALSTVGFGQGGTGGTGGGTGGGFGGGQLRGVGGGGFGGGVGGSQLGGGTGQATYTSRVRQIESEVNSYLDTGVVKNILTPGEFSEWTLTLEAGEVVIADARSDAFDPALEIVFIENEGEDDEEIVIHAVNDDRFPGDQRPLIIWRCEKAGVYRLRARCFKDKSGGQFFLRSKTYRSIDLTGGEANEMVLEGEREFLIKVPMKAGEIKQVVFELPDDEDYAWARFHNVISPIGLPDIKLTQPLNGVLSNALMAAVDGDYYVIAGTTGRKDQKVRISTRIVPTVEIAKVEGSYTAKAQPNQISLWKFSVKKGDILKVSMPELSLSSRFVVSEYPDTSEYDLKDPKTNPFFPQLPDEEKDNKGPVYATLPGRARDPRIAIYVVQRDADLWLATNGNSRSQDSYTMTVSPGASELVASKKIEDRLEIGYTDYWAFDAKAGDVMTFDATMTGFAGDIAVLDPDLREVWSRSVDPDETTMDWNLIVNKPGKYLVAVSAIGDGASGDYTLEREEFSAREFSRGAPAKGDFSSGQAEVWKFTAKPDDPLFVHWEFSNSNYTSSIIDEEGNRLVLPLTYVDANNQFGVLKVDEERTYVIVLISRGLKASYTISLNDIPGYAKKKK